LEKGKIPQAKKGVLWAKYGRYLNYCTVWYGTVLELACCMGGGRYGLAHGYPNQK
jgi:hypothetical protein